MRSRSQRVVTERTLTVTVLNYSDVLTRFKQTVLFVNQKRQWDEMSRDFLVGREMLREFVSDIL